MNSTDGSIAARGDAFNVSTGGGKNSNSTINIQTMDSEVIGQSLDFAAETLDANNQTVDRAFDFGKDALDTVTGTVDEAFGFGRDSLDFGQAALDFAAGSDERTANVINASTEGLRQLSNKVIDAVLEDNASQRESASNELLNAVGKYSTIIVLGVAAAGAYAISRKSA
ncbi:hypothetical protein [Coraliomargarita parva]|uniref:hypothetical protein n=1 Tax=Coraliomargarita parva TaxID=3014050 RepID=UPI0022B2B794|nr:hypothetical protein [Coraliomargarita parva]